jgi:hypothetical protein
MEFYRKIFKVEIISFNIMRSSQWSIIGIFFIVMGIWFIRQDSIAEKVCGVAGTAPMNYTAEEWIEKGSEPVNNVGLWCVNTEIYDPFIWLLTPLGIVFLICAWIELMAEKRRKK